MVVCHKLGVGLRAVHFPLKSTFLTDYNTTLGLFRITLGYGNYAVATPEKGDRHYEQQTHDLVLCLC